MKNTTFFFAFVFCSFLFKNETQAQFSMVYTMGISPQQSPEGHYIFVNRSLPKEEFTFDIAQVKASYLIGAGTKYNIAPFYFMGEVQYNKREYVYDVQYTYPGFGRTEDIQQYRESMHMINIPLSVGVDIGVMEVYSGFLPQIVLSQQSELEKVNGYSQKLNSVRFGWHSGVAAKVANVRIGLNWQMDFNNYADHIYFNNENLVMLGRPSRLYGMLSYAF